jgi:hypothetical protein
MIFWVEVDGGVNFTLAASVVGVKNDGSYSFSLPVSEWHGA